MPTLPKTPDIKPDKKTNLYMGSLICAMGALFYCYEFILRIIPGALQTEISAAFGHISASTFGQLSAFYYFAYSPMQVPVGMLMDRFGPRRLLTFACLCCTVGSFMFTYSSSMATAESGRFFIGFGSSFAFVGVLSLTTQWLPRRYFSLVAGLIMTLGMLGLVYGEIKITEIADTLGLHYVLMSMVVMGGVLTLLIFLLVRDAPGEYPTKSQPIKDFFAQVGEVIKSPQVWLIGFVGACLYTSMSVFGELWGKTYLEKAHHLSKIEAAQTISVMFVGWGIGAPIVGYFSDQTGRRILPLILGAILSLICIGVVLYWPGLSYIQLNLFLFFYGIFSSSEIIVFIMAEENSGTQLSGTVFAVTNMIITLGGVIFQPLVGVLLDLFNTSELVDGAHVYTVADYQFALSIIPLSLLMVTIVAFFLKNQKK